MKIFWTFLLTLGLAVGAVPGTSIACTSSADCNDGNLCTTDTCDLVNGCIHAPTPACTPRIDVPLAGQKLKLHIPLAKPDKKGIGIGQRFGGITTSNIPLPFTAGDPRSVGGSLRVYSETGGFDATYPLPAWQWEYLSNFDPANPTSFSGYKYKDATNADGPVDTILFRAGYGIKIRQHGPGTTFALGSNPNPVNVVLTVGDHRYCMVFGGSALWRPGKLYLALRPTAPSSCPCTTDSDCDDGDSANGANVCTVGFCQ